MRYFRRFLFAFLGFLSAIVTYLLTPGQWLNRLIAITLCTVLTADNICIPKNYGRAVAAIPTELENIKYPFNNFFAQRSSEFDENFATPVPPGGNVTPPPFPIDPGPNHPLRRPDFDDRDGIDMEINNMLDELVNTNSGTYTFTDSLGCNQTLKIKYEASNRYTESSLISIPVDGISCSNGYLNLFATYKDNGNYVTLDPQNGNPTLEIQGLKSDIWNILYTDSEGIRQSYELRASYLNYLDHSDLLSSDFNKLIGIQTKSINKVNPPVDMLLSFNTLDRCEYRDYCKQQARVADLIKEKVELLTAVLSNPLMQWLTIGVSSGVESAVTSETIKSALRIAAVTSAAVTAAVTFGLFADSNYCFYYYGETGGYHRDLLMAFAKNRGFTEGEAKTKLDDFANKKRSEIDQKCPPEPPAPETPPPPEDPPPNPPDSRRTTCYAGIRFCVAP